MCHLSRIQIISSVFFLLISLTIDSNAQLYRANHNFQEFQNKPYYFGLTLGMTNSKYKVFHGENFTNGIDTVAVAEGLNVPGFTVNIISNLKIGNYFDFRFLPGFSFAERQIEFKNFDGAPRTRRVESVFFEAPFHVRYKSDPYKDKRAFIVAGLKYSYDIASNSKTRNADNLIKISPHDFQLEVGAGIQMFFPYFIFSPEIKFSQGIGNILIFNGEIQDARIMEKILSRILTISFHFEG